MIIVLPMPIAVLVLIIGTVLVIGGRRKGDRTETGIGGTLLGVSGFAFSMLFVQYDLSSANEWGTFSPSAGYILLFGLIVFLSGIATAFGLHQLATRTRR